MAPRNPSLLVLLAMAACATRGLPARGPAARARFDPDRADAVFSAAVERLARLGYRLETCDQHRDALATVPVEFDAPCNLTSCLARDVVSFKLGHSVAKLSLDHRVWNPTVKQWVAVRDGTVVRTEAALLAEVMDGNRAAPPRDGDGACREVRRRAASLAAAR